MIKINKLLKKYHNDWNQVLKEASLLEDRGAIHDAIAIYTAFLSKNPHHAGVQEALATAFLKGGEFSKSYSAFNKALKWGANRPQTYLHKGIVEARLGLHEEAFESINQALQLKEDYSLAHNNLGKLLGDLGRTEEALSSYQQAILCDPDYLDALFNRGVTLYGIGDFNQALSCFEKALLIYPDDPKIKCYHTMTLLSLGRLDESVAMSSLEKLLLDNENNTDILNSLASLYKGQHKLSTALAAYDRVVAKDQQNAMAHCNRGTVLCDLYRHEEALLALDQAIAINPILAEAYANRAITLVGLHRLDKALESAEHAVWLNPRLPEALVNLAVVLTKLRRFEKALDQLAIAIEIKPHFGVAFSNRSDVYLQMGQLEDAHRDALKAITLESELPSAHNNLGVILTEMLALDDALAAFDRAIALAPESADAHFNKALTQMLQGHLLEGFKGYEWRWKSYLRQFARDFGRPLWLGEESLLGRTILVSMEQGFGDFIQYARYLPLLAAKAAQVVVEVPPALKELMQTLEGAYRWVLPGEPLPPFDVYCPIMSLSLAFKTDMDSIPRSIPYLSVGETHQQRWALKLGPKKQPRIGIVWSGSATHLHDRKRSIPFEHLKPLLQGPYEFHVLQKEIRDHERAEVLSTPHLHLHSDDLQSFADTAGLLAQMDLVITVDTSVAHLAGALGFPMWVLVSYSPDWRWLLDRSDSPWYSSACVFRQSERGNWGEMIQRVKTALLETLIV